MSAIVGYSGISVLLRKLNKDIFTIATVGGVEFKGSLGGGSGACKKIQ